MLNGGANTDACDGGPGLETITECEQVAGEGEVRVVLRWTNRVDMDLHVREPNGEVIYFEDPTSSTGGQLDVDVQCTGNGGLENIVWGPSSTPSAGTYRITVDEYAQCGQGRASWTVEAWVGDRKVFSRTGTGSQANMPFFVALS